MFWWGAIVGGIAVGAIEFLAWMMYTVIGGLTREGERKELRKDLERRRTGHALRRAAIVTAAVRQHHINREIKRMEEAEQASAEG